MPLVASESLPAAQPACASNFIVKNTFICAVDSQEVPSPIKLRARAKTAGVIAGFGPDLLDDFETDVSEEALSGEAEVESLASSSAGSQLGLRSRLDTYDLVEEEQSPAQVVPQLSQLEFRCRFNTYDSMEDERSPATWARLLASPRKVTSSLSQNGAALTSVPAPVFCVKNTFICALDSEESSPPNKTRARAKTAGFAPGHGLAAFDDFHADVAEEADACHDAFPSSPFEVDLDSEEGCQVALSLMRGGDLQRNLLTQALHGRVLALAGSQHAHKVLEAVVQCMSVEQAAFIAVELSQCSLEAFLHATTCSVMCRLLERFPADVRIVALVDVLLSGDVASLCSHKFGHMVMVTLVSVGIPRQAFFVIAALQSNPQRFARHRFASSVVSAAVRSTSAVGNSLACALMAQPGTVVSLACHTFGVNVVRGLLASPWHSWEVLQFLLKGSQRLQKDRYGRELMREIGALSATST